jgi:hypothetical protein
MKVASLFVAGLAFVTLSMTAVNAGPRKPIIPVEAINECNLNLGPGLSAAPCKAAPGVVNYADCTKYGRDRGWDPRDAWWYCSSVHFKS